MQPVCARSSATGTAWCCTAIRLLRTRLSASSSPTRGRYCRNAGSSGTGPAAAWPSRSDLLRYEILKAGLGIYADCDVFCLRPIEDADYIFGREGTFKGKQLATAVLKLPPDSPTLTALCAIKDTPDFAPPWEKPAKPRRLAWLRGRVPAPSLEDLPWASIGPHALSYYAEQHGIADRAAPIDRFYPVPWMQLELLFDPGLSLQELVTHRSDTVHLYNSTLTRRGRADIPEGSPMWEMVHAK